MPTDGTRAPTRKNSTVIGRKPSTTASGMTSERILRKVAEDAGRIRRPTDDGLIEVRVRTVTEPGAEDDDDGG